MQKWTTEKRLHRLVTYALRAGLSVTKYPKPKLYSGPGSVQKMPEAVKRTNINNVMVVTDKGLTGLGLLDPMLKSLEENGIKYAVFDGVQPNPTIDNIEAGVSVYNQNNCQGLILFGGGSVMDCGKVIAARVRRPNKSVVQFRGLMKIMRKLPPLFAVPTTAGTGSEATVAALITNSNTHEKMLIADLFMVPKYAFLDPELMAGLPKHITSTTGIDTLVHAIESYIGLHDLSDVRTHAETATRLVFENLEAAYADGSDLDRRNKMSLASYHGGCACTKGGLGYIHAISHNMSGQYGVAHGLANAIIMPLVLRISREDAEPKLAKLAIEAGLGHHGESDKDLSIRFIEEVEAMNERMGIPTYIKELKAEDIPVIAERARKEALLYAVPTILDQKELEEAVAQLLPN